MSKRPIVTYGHPALRQVAQPVHKVSAKIQKLVQDMMDTMYAANGCGLAANQIGEDRAVFVLDCGTKTNPLPAMVFINPRIVRKKGVCLSREGCLSFPEVFVDVKRYSDITVRFMDLKGRQQEMTVTLAQQPLLCRAIQHEMDHLNGIVFVDHVMDQYGTDELLKQHNLPPIDPAKLRKDEVLDALFAETPNLPLTE